MSLRKLPYFLVFFSFLFTACQKDGVIHKQDYKTLGTSAHDLLSSSTFNSLQVQISYMPGFEPETPVLTSITKFLNTYLDKPGGIEIFEQQVASSGKNSEDLNQIVETEKANRSIFTNGKNIAVHILITDNYYSDKTVFATSYWNTSICIFGHSLTDNSSGDTSKNQLLIILIEHEFGHLFGLVNQGTVMLKEHQDIAHGAHCSNPNCLMYYRERPFIGPGPFVIPHLDSNCEADLKANGGK